MKKQSEVGRIILTAILFAIALTIFRISSVVTQIEFDTMATMFILFMVIDNGLKIKNNTDDRQK